ncbi:MAG TPA: hypothetical protein VGD31_00435 [Sphingobacteriaceae bacterium]
MGFYLLYDHFDHLLDELDFARRAYGTVYAYVKLLEQRSEQDGRVTIATAIAVTWMRPVERIIHAARMPVDTICIATDHPERERQIAQLRERSRVARRMVYAELTRHNIQADHNLLLTVGLREELMQLPTEQLLWEIVVSGEGDASEHWIVPLE